MRKVLWLVTGVTAVSAAAFFMGAAAAMTGAPVFYDARFPQTAEPAAEGYEVSPGGTPAAQAGEPGTDAVRTGVDAPDRADVATPTPTPTPRAEAPVGETPAPTTPPAKSPGHGGRPGDSVDRPTAPPQDGIGAANPTPAEQQEWLAFQQLVRDCMADEGQDYLYWEWWNPTSDTSNRFPAMPADLTPDEHLAWELALNGTSPGGADYRWQDAGCWGEAVHRTGGTN
jgi:hypothetical protein